LKVGFYFSASLGLCQVSTEAEQLVVDDFTKILMPNKLAAKCYKEPGICFPTTPLTVNYKNKSYSYDHLIEPWQGSFFIYFVKLNAKSHAVDLDGDGFKEIAIYPAVAGNAPKTKAYIYTVKGHELLPYGIGDHYWESGKHVTNIKKDPKFKPDI
jgi:hypothetical protein